MPTKPKKAQPFRSSVELATIVEFGGDLSETRKSLEEQLKKLGIDPEVSVTNLPRGKAGQREAIIRLVGLARGNGLYITLGKRGGASIGVTRVAEGPATLQSGHH